MDDEVAALLDELHDFGVRHDAGKADRLERMRNLEPDSARMLALLVRATAAKRVLELGTSNGYSTIWLADALHGTGGHLTTVDVDESRTAMARSNVRRAHLHDVVEFRIEDAAHTLAGSADSWWDMIFLDAERPYYAGYWPELVRALRPGGLLAVDNVISHADQVAEFRKLVTSDPRVTEALVPTGAGVLLVLANPSHPTG
jgi:predicted O-methyltransferase YrrM